MKEIITCLIAALLLLPAASEEKKQENKNTANISDLIKGLDDKDFSKRETSAKKLTNLGKAAIPALTRATNHKSPELSRRALEIIIGHYNSSDKKLKRRSTKALTKISEAGKNYAEQAKKTLEPPKPETETKNNASAKTNIQINGNKGNTKSVSIMVQNGITTVDAKENGNHVKISKGPQGITIENTVEKDGKKETQKFKAANAEELKANHPEAHKLMEKYTGNIKTDDGNVRIKVESSTKVE
tara:strand:- start:273 stop:1001 length:729 start_codon:yes stop_codon:yes gene_type:complete